jgi:hypothetical protein
MAEKKEKAPAAKSEAKPVAKAAKAPAEKAAPKPGKASPRTKAAKPAAEKPQAAVDPSKADVVNAENKKVREVPRAGPSQDLALGRAARRASGLGRTRS